MMKRLMTVVLGVALLGMAGALVFSPIGSLTAAVQEKGKEKKKGGKKGKRITKGVCVLVPIGEKGAKGVIWFTQKGKKVHITGKVTGLTPGKHGFHIHEFGDLTSDDGTSTGGHFNPTNKKHGAPEDEERHVGDLGNIVANKQGVAEINMTDTVINLNGPYSIIGRGIIVHAGADDLKTQPTGDAGARVAGGVIGVAKNGG